MSEIVGSAIGFTLALGNLPRIWCGFPGVGKTHLCEITSWNDSDSSIYHNTRGGVSHSRWPNNYILHLRDTRGPVFASTHPEVLSGLQDRRMDYGLVYPTKDALGAYIKRYVNRQNDADFVATLARNWDAWIDALDKDSSALVKLRLQPNETLTDYFVTQGAPYA